MKKGVFVTILGAGLLAGMVLVALPAQALDEKGCLQCHGKPDFQKTNGQGNTISLYVDQIVLDASAHRFIDCTQCHSTDPHASPSPLTKLSLAKKCGTCHQYERKLHEGSIHGQLLAQGDEEVASCVDCHSTQGTPHSVIRVLRPESPAYRKNIADTCTRCHGDEELMAGYGIVEKTYETYMRTSHGKAMRLAEPDLRQLNTATCTSCHGAHNIKKSDDPDSPVASLANLTATCEKCHSGAGEEFARGFMGHKEASPQNSPLVYYVERFFLVLTATVVAGGIALVTLVSIGSASHGLWRRGKGDRP